MTQYPNAGKPWTNDQVAALKDLYAHGSPLEEISKEMGRTPYAIIGKMVQVGILFIGRDGNYFNYPEEP